MADDTAAVADNTAARDAAPPVDPSRSGADQPVARPGLQLKPVQLALYAGWTMAVLYGTIPGDQSDDAAAPASARPPELPTVNELAPEQRRTLERVRLSHLLADLLPDFAGLSKLDAMPAGNDGGEPETRKSTLESLNLDILEALTATPPELQLAYELGRSLRETANPPNCAATGLAEQLGRMRIAKLQQWLVTLSPEFPELTAAVVAGSLGRWSDLAAVTVGSNETRQMRSTLYSLRQLPPQEKQESIAAAMCAYLLQQGDIWLMLLIGELATSGLLTPEGYVTAGEAALHRSGAIARAVLRHYWFGLLVLAVALGGTLFLAIRYLEGASEVWTSIAAIAGSLAVSAQTIASTASRLTAEAARPVFAIAEEDAMAWAITTLPPLTLTFRGVRHLRRAGIAPTVSLSRF
jgi:hypothetical protein